MHKASIRKNSHQHHNHSAFNLHDNFDEIKEALANATQDVRGRIGEIFYDSMDNVKERTGDVKDAVADYTKHKPFKTLGIAVAAGFLLGFILRGK